ncbi:MAG TPA: aminotransferase class III-fold pyridoxal phosphate-dependent enzyme, partial [Mycobacteriales bacterium]|nr:aminotransferase class III-fold pyridoxal phosphate-dependent enzyme [Mycobacteriales bacterium]
ATTTRVMVEDDLPGRADRLGRELLAALAPLAEEAPTVGDVRGQGLAIGIELVADKATKAPASKDQVRRAFLALLEAGVLVMVGGNSLRLYPPLNVETGLAHEAVDIIGRTLREFPRP